MCNDKIDRQLALEAESVLLGTQRYHRNHSRTDEADTGPGMVQTKRIIHKITDRIEDEIGSHKARRGRPSVYQKYFALFEPEQLALAAARTVLNAVAGARPVTLTRVAMKVASGLEDAEVYRQMMGGDDESKALAAAGLRKAKKSRSARHSKAVLDKHLRHAQEHTSVTGPDWSNRDKLLVGSKLIEIIIEETGLVEVREVWRGKRSTKHLRATPALLDWLTRQHEAAALAEPWHLPMIVPPKPWTLPIGGGYLGVEGKQPLKLLKVRDHGTVDDLFSTDMPRLYDAVNAIQETPWRINKGVLAVLRPMFDSGTAAGGIAALDEGDHIPPKPHDIDTNEEALKIWKVAAAQAHEEQARSVSKRMALSQALWVAEKFTDEEEIYFPHQLDFRGRIYPTPAALNPQAEDAPRALLQFAEGKKLEPHGAFWLAVHIANLFGVDKVGFDERVSWVQENSEDLVRSAVDPHGHGFWLEADKPFCALAACFEWLGYTIEGPDYVSHLPIAMDGSCSGLQHYSALLQDPVGGSAVNLVPADKPADIYTTVMERTCEVLQYHAEGGSDLARKWYDRVTRKIVKRPCMTYAYSATQRGMRDQIIDEMRKATDGNYIPGYRNFEAANYLAPIVRQCIEDTVRAASDAMAWLKIVAQRLAKANLPAVWVSPVGLPITQKQLEFTGQQVRLVFEGKRVELTLAVDGTKMNSRKQQSSIAPNFIHSMDAAHLMRTVNTCYPAGIRSFAMIHDSFGTHACDVDLMNKILRMEFVAMYEDQDWLQVLKDHCEAVLGEELPPLPERGDLDLQQVEDSDYFFG